MSYSSGDDGTIEEREREREREREHESIFRIGPPPLPMTKTGIGTPFFLFTPFQFIM